MLAVAGGGEGGCYVMLQGEASRPDKLRYVYILKLVPAVLRGVSFFVT